MNINQKITFDLKEIIHNTILEKLNFGKKLLPTYYSYHTAPGIWPASWVDLITLIIFGNLEDENKKKIDNAFNDKYDVLKSLYYYINDSLKELKEQKSRDFLINYIGNIINNRTEFEAYTENIKKQLTNFITNDTFEYNLDPNIFLKIFKEHSKQYIDNDIDSKKLKGKLTIKIKKDNDYYILDDIDIENFMSYMKSYDKTDNSNKEQSYKYKYLKYKKKYLEYKNLI